MSLLSLQKQLVRKLKDNSFARTRPSTRGALDTYRASFYRTSKRLYTEKAEGFAKHVRIHMALDMSCSMEIDQLRAGWEAMKTVRDTFKHVADTEIYFWDNLVYHCTDEIIDAIRQCPSWDNRIEHFLKDELQYVWQRSVSTTQQAFESRSGPRPFFQNMTLAERMLYMGESDVHELLWYGPAYKDLSNQEIIQRSAVLSKTHPKDLQVLSKNRWGGTDDIVALTKIFSQCAALPSERHIIFFFTDGEPNSDATGLGRIHNGLRTPIVEDRVKWIRKNCATRGRDITFIPIGIDTDVAKTYATGTTFSSRDGAEGFLRAMLKHLQYLPIFSQ